MVNTLRVPPTKAFNKILLRLGTSDSYLERDDIVRGTCMNNKNAANMTASAIPARNIIHNSIHLPLDGSKRRLDRSPTPSSPKRQEGLICTLIVVLI
jgi:hypothetical protein